MEQICMDLKHYNDVSNPYLRIHVKLDPTLYQDHCPPEIIENMHSLHYGIQYNSTILVSNDVKIRFFTKTDNNCLHQFHIVMTVLRYMVQFSKKPKHISVDFIFTDVKKHLPIHKGEIISPSILNTGYTDGLQIVVFRQEEWLKVFIHECIHFFMYDQILRDKPMLVYRLFPICKKVDVNESYCEVWARILNCCIISVINVFPVEILLERERNYSIEQMVKILNYMGLEYQDLWNETTKYNEGTNAFAYLVLTAILMQNPTRFVNWCKQYNTSMITIENPDEYVSLIEKNYKKSKFLKSLHTNSSLSTTMTINNIHL
jgi:hypothetical protein